MIMDGCQGKPRTPTIREKICPVCGSTIEIFSTDALVQRLMPRMPVRQEWLLYVSY